MSGPLVHLVRHPTTPSLQPTLLVLLHGVGSHEADLFALAVVLDWVKIPGHS